MDLFEYVAWTQLVARAKRVRAASMAVPVAQLLTVAEMVEASPEGQRLAALERRFREKSPT